MRPDYYNSETRESQEIFPGFPCFLFYNGYLGVFPLSWHKDLGFRTAAFALPERLKPLALRFQLLLAELERIKLVVPALVVEQLLVSALL